MKLEGILPALTTPFADGAVATGAFERNLERYERLDLGGYLVLGSTGEAVLLDDEERQHVLDAARGSIRAGRPLVAGVPAESTRDALRQARVAAACGADAVLVSTPHYYREQVTPRALVDHFSAVADGSPVPIVLYNVPKFTGIAIPQDVVLELSGHENVSGLKESSGDLDYLRRILSGAAPGFRVLCGAASLLRPALDAGAAGAILAAATAIPEPLIRIAADARYPADALEECTRASSLVASRHGIAGIKRALDLRGLAGGPVRPPLASLSAAAAREIEDAVTRLVERGLIPRREL